MGIKQIKLEHFRCYADLSLDLKHGVNLLIGDNASGKTSLLKACRYVLSSFFAGYSDENTHWSSPWDADFSVSVIEGVVQPEPSVKISFKVFDWPDEEVTFQILKKSKKNSRPLIGGLQPYRDYARGLLDSGDELPLFASFTTEDIHSTRKINLDKFKKYHQKASFGYYECLNGSGFLPYWQKRMLVLKEAGENLQEIEVVRRAVIDSLGSEGCGVISDVEVRHNLGEVYYTLSDGRKVPTDFLSDGYRRVVNIVTDIACRSSLLNGRLYGLEAAKQTKGTVLIDEIDMHLHPKMQARVLRGLKNAFPNLQFIVSSHAPMVMTNVENNQQDGVFKLDYDGNTYKAVPSDPYGLDATAITEDILQQPARNTEVDFQLKSLFGLIDEGRYDQARTLLRDLKERFGQRLSELAKAETMICLLSESDEED